MISYIAASKYFHMPKVYGFDDYDQCMGIHKDKTLYCVVNTYVKPDAESELYGFIRYFSSNKKQHFRLDKLQRGLCMNTYWKTIQRLVKSQGNISSRNSQWTQG